MLPVVRAWLNTFKLELPARNISNSISVSADELGVLQARLAAAEAEVERLREALEWINAEPEDPLKVQQRALAALGRG